MTDAVVQRVADLIRLAVDAGAAESEARTAAMVACRLTVQHHLQVSPPNYANRPPPPPPPPGQPPPRDPEELRAIHSRSATRCKRCAGPVAVDELVWWSPGRGVIHIRCRKDKHA